MLLLHGFPSSSFGYRNLIPALAPDFRLLAPDLPGFGFTEVPAGKSYEYSFKSFAETIKGFLQALNVDKFSMYVFDYGAPTGFRIAIEQPERIEGLVSQNGNAYEAGFGDFWKPIKQYWQDHSPASREALRPFTQFDATKWQYTEGVARPELLAPETFHLDAALMQRPNNAEIQLDLFLDYGSNVPLYPKFQEFIRNAKIPMLVIWGKNDQIFIAPGAEAFAKDRPDAVIELLDTGHFALETHCEHIAEKIIQTLRRKI